MAANGGRDAATGQFLKGWPGGPGRRKGQRDLRTIIAEEFERQGKDIDTVATSVVAGMLRKAINGDVQAGKLLLDRLFPHKLELGESFVDLIRGAWQKDEQPQ